MFYARDSNNNSLEPTPKAKAFCPLCGAEVLSKCGAINVWHWAHKTKDCDPWGEPETPWHRGWKSVVSRDCQEVVVENHRADIKLKNSVVIELQNSPISAETIKEREEFYQDMIWIFNAEKQAERMYCTTSFLSIRLFRYEDSNDFWRYKIEEFHCPSKPFERFLFDVEQYKECVHKSDKYVRNKNQQAFLHNMVGLAEKRAKEEFLTWKDLFDDLTYHGESFYYYPEELCGEIPSPSPALDIGLKRSNPNFLWGLTFRDINVEWPNKKKSWLTATKPILLDIGSPIVLLCWGEQPRLISKPEFIRWMKSNSSWISS